MQTAGGDVRKIWHPVADGRSLNAIFPSFLHFTWRMGDGEMCEGIGAGADATTR